MEAPAAAATDKMEAREREREGERERGREGERGGNLEHLLFYELIKSLLGFH